MWVRVWVDVDVDVDVECFIAIEPPGLPRILSEYAIF